MARQLRGRHGGGQSAVVQSCGVQLGRFHRLVQWAIRGTSTADWGWLAQMELLLFTRVGFKKSAEHKRNKYSIQAIPNSVYQERWFLFTCGATACLCTFPSHVHSAPCTVAKCQSLYCVFYQQLIKHPYFCLPQLAVSTVHSPWLIHQLSLMSARPKLCVTQHLYEPGDTDRLHIPGWFTGTLITP